MPSSSPSPTIENRRLRLGSRGSPLAIWQAEHVAAMLAGLKPQLEVEIIRIRTAGEKFAEWDLQKIGVGVFTREIDQALLENRIDLAVHSLKDLPTEMPAGLVLAAVPERESPLDAWISADGTPLDRLPVGARVGTSSPRRQAQILHRRGDLQIVPVRGNVETRLRKLAELGLAGTILAHAGLRRLGKEGNITALIPTDWILPAVGQGALAIVARADSPAILELLRSIDHAPTRACVAAERAFLKTLRGGCQIPAAGLATLDASGRLLSLEALVSSPDGRRLLREGAGGPAERGESIGAGLAEKLLARGGDEILAALRSSEAEAALDPPAGPAGRRP